MPFNAGQSPATIDPNTSKDPMASDLVAVENRLWATADHLWANTGLKPSEFSAIYRSRWF